MEAENLKEYLRYAYKLEASLNQQRDLLSQTKITLGPKIYSLYDKPLLKLVPDSVFIPEIPDTALIPEIADTPSVSSEEKEHLHQEYLSKKLKYVAIIRINNYLGIISIISFFLGILMIVLSGSLYISPFLILCSILAFSLLFGNGKDNLKKAENELQNAEEKLSDIEKRERVRQKEILDKKKRNKKINSTREQEVLSKKRKNEEIKEIRQREISEKERINKAIRSEWQENARKREIYAQNVAFLESSIQETQKALDTLYAKGIIFPKYLQDGLRFIAVSSFYEYLVSGRCEQLKGPDGAYNLFEAERRQDMILTSLSEIKSILHEMSSQLEQIKRNQYMIYKAIQEGNEISRQMLSVMKDSVQVQKRTAQLQEHSVRLQENSVQLQKRSVQLQERTLEYTALSSYFSEITAQNTEAIKWLEGFY